MNFLDLTALILVTSIMISVIVSKKNKEKSKVRVKANRIKK